MSKATIVSIFPYAINNRYITVVPPLAHVDPCKDDKYPVFHVINDHHTYRYVGEGKSVKIPIVAFEHAKAIVRDLKKSLFGTSSRRQAYPGVVCLDGEVSPTEFMAKHKDLYELMQKQQLNWKNNIIELADNDWSAKKDKRLITQLQVDMARSLGLNKEWSRDAIDDKRVECPACYSNIHPDATKCAHCGTIINPELHEARFGSGVNIANAAMDKAAEAKKKIDALKGVKIPLASELTVDE